MNNSIAQKRTDKKLPRKKHSKPKKQQSKSLSRKKTPKERDSFRADVLERFQQLKLSIQFSKVQKLFQNLLGRHSVIQYDKKFGFREQWEISNKQNKKQLFQNTLPYLAINLMLLLSLNCLLWIVSTKIQFDIEDTEWVYYIVVAVSVAEIIKKIPFLLTMKTQLKIITVLNELFSIAISLLLSSQNSLRQTFWMRLLGITLVGLLYLRAKAFYEHFKIFHLSTKYRQIVQIFDLFVLIIAISHAFALALFATTRLNPTNNWMTHLQMVNHEWTTGYVYSLYFSTTTLLTVGYGDIVPTNVPQILTVLLTQLIGIAAFAYAVNLIGVAFSKISQRQHKLQKNLRSVQQIGKVNRLKPDLTCRMRSQLLNQKTLDSDLSLNEENELLGKFSQPTREQVQIQSSTKVIKRSIFMIGNWTGKMQSKIAHRLIKQIYSTDEIVPQTVGKQKIYILDKGKIDIITNSKSGYKLCFQKVLKTMFVEQGSEMVKDNVYGYSFVMSLRQINLNAIAKSNSICYSLSKATFLEILMECEQDLQHYHEMKDRINAVKFPEKIQAPEIMNYREHYWPSVYYVIAHRNVNNKKNERVFRQRSQRRMRIQCSNSNKKQIVGRGDLFYKMSKQERLSKGSHFPISSIKLPQLSDYDYSQVDDLERTQIKLDVEDSCSPFDIQFESCNQFQRYFKRYNYEDMVKRLNMKIYFRPHIKQKQTQKTINE